MITIPGSNISIPGIQIPTSQAISIPSSSGVQMPVASVAGVAQQDKNKEPNKPSSPGPQGSSQGSCGWNLQTVKNTVHQFRNLTIRIEARKLNLLERDYVYYYCVLIQRNSKL